MDEEEYRDTYHNVNPLRCVFEKSINSRQTGCRRSHRFCLADREGIACTDKHSQAQCQLFLDALRNKAVFILKMTRLAGPLPHAKEIRVQTGGVLGLQDLFAEKVTQQPDINLLLDQAVEKYSGVEKLPFDELMRAISQYQGRKRQRK